MSSLSQTLPRPLLCWDCSHPVPDVPNSPQLCGTWGWQCLWQQKEGCWLYLSSCDLSQPLLQMQPWGLPQHPGGAWRSWQSCSLSQADRATLLLPRLSTEHVLILISENETSIQHCNDDRSAQACSEMRPRCRDFLCFPMAYFLNKFKGGQHFSRSLPKLLFFQTKYDIHPPVSTVGALSAFR